MSEDEALRKMYKPETDENYAKAKKVIQILIKNEVVRSHQDEKEYINIWNAALEIVKS